MKDLIGRLRRLSRRGPSYGFYLAHGVVVPRVTLRLARLAQLHRRSRRWVLGGGGLALASLTGFAVGGFPGAAIGTLLAGLVWGWAGSGSRRRMEKELRRLSLETGRTQNSLVLGDLDNDGRLRADQADIPSLPTVAADEFTPRYRFDLTLVSGDDEVLVRKNYRGDHGALRREAACLARLDGIDAAPAIQSLDRLGGTLEKTFVEGPTLRDLLVQAGARILSAETEQEPGLQQLDKASRLEAVWKRGRKVLATVHETSDHDLPADLLAAMERALDSIHARGVTGCSLTFGNIVFRQPGGQPVFIDFDKARLHRQAEGPFFDLARDRDRQLFNRIYGTQIETEASVDKALAGVLSTRYAPLDLGRGLVTHGFWSVDSGTGRWEYLNRAALRDLIQDKRILDLGTHNGILSLTMLREGARAVTAVERNPEMAAAAGRLHRILEWRDMRPYDFQIRCSDMRAILEEDWGTFDLVTAFCSLYYLAEEDMHRVLKRAAEIAPALVLQAKTDTRPDAQDGKAVKSTVEFLTQAARDAGWTITAVHSKHGFSRPLLIAQRAA